MQDLNKYGKNAPPIPPINIAPGASTVPATHPKSLNVSLNIKKIPVKKEHRIAMKNITTIAKLKIGNPIIKQTFNAPLCLTTK